MREEYDFSDSRPNPYTEKERRRVTMNIDSENIDYFKAEFRPHRSSLSGNHQHVFNRMSRARQTPVVHVMAEKH